MAVANIGAKFIYSHPEGLGFGEHNKVDAGHGDQTAEMKELDLKDGQEVTLMEYDAESDWPLVEWTDGVGVNRITTIEPGYFDQYFQPV